MSTAGVLYPYTLLTMADTNERVIPASVRPSRQAPAAIDVAHVNPRLENNTDDSAGVRENKLSGRAFNLDVH